MARIHELLGQLRASNPSLAAEIEREVDVLSGRRAFGLNFERHTPEAVELPGRKVRVGDKVRVQPPRGELSRAAHRALYRVVSIERRGGSREAMIAPISENSGDPEAGDTSRSTDVDDLVVVAEFRDPIYPGLVSTGKVERGGDKPFHTVINAENFHALQTLLFTHRGKVDAIYIDPPYNTGARDWKYNNDYVEGDDLYRHSKWLAFMERRLLMAKELLNPDNSVLIVTIDEKEYLRLGLLLEQTFPEGKMQMVSSLINPTGAIRTNEFTRTNEFIYFVSFGAAELAADTTDIGEGEEVRWNQLRRFELSSARRGPQPRPDQFYPIYVDVQTGRIAEIGDSIPVHVERDSVPDRPGCVTLWPLKPDGTEMIWGLTPTSLRLRLAQGFVRVTRGKGADDQFSVSYLTSGKVGSVADGSIRIVGRRPDGSAIVERVDGVKKVMPTTQWVRESHSAQAYGTKLLSQVIPNRRFPFPKSLYAVEDVLRYFVGSRPSATVVDFFSGSGTTAHAVMRLNKQDGGRRRSISVTNNEVSADEQAKLRKQNLRPGDPDWEQWGICDYITKPRIRAAITGQTPDGKPIKGDYKFTDVFPMADGFDENVEFFTLTYEAPMRVQSNREFARIAPFLWLRAGSQGRRIESLETGWDVADAYGVLADLDQTDAFLTALANTPSVAIAYIVTDEDRLFEAISRELPSGVEPVRLYQSYLSNFEIDAMRSVR
ncbi:site-specific DNA-methyltransferase [Microbacterium oleivorans]|uniref:site-specific DNA-methyltransferase n=1 Tax=Microbacterium oleivorans TaxID=273677 RepID=UPI002040804B|nr:DNA methyltransferase [Microbacterium oleivorans]MCM3695940.1 site-specific DNA-methyltransferase [Microbacterium oleivorans]